MLTVHCIAQKGAPYIHIDRNGSGRPYGARGPGQLLLSGSLMPGQVLKRQYCRAVCPVYRRFAVTGTCRLLCFDLRNGSQCTCALYRPFFLQIILDGCTARCWGESSPLQVGCPTIVVPRQAQLDSFGIICGGVLVVVDLAVQFCV